MTEATARPARWVAPLVLAPCAAAVFGASMWWAGGVTPVTASKPAPPATAPRPSAAELRAAAQAQAHRQALADVVNRERRAAAALQNRLNALGHQLKQVSAAADAQRRAAQSSGGGYSGGSSGGGSYSGSSGGSGGSVPVYAAPAPVVAQPVYVAPAPAPAPPPVQATTGASGKP